MRFGVDDTKYIRDVTNALLMVYIETNLSNKYPRIFKKLSSNLDELDKILSKG